MTNAISQLDPARFNLTSFAELLPKRSTMVGEDPETFEGLRAGLLQSLAPATPYECVVAENIVVIEWELLQHQRMRQAKLSQKSRNALIDHIFEAFSDTEYLGPDEDWDEDKALAAGKDLADRAASRDPAIRAEAFKQLDALGIDLIEIMSKAYRVLGGAIEFHHEAIKDLERRRNQVRREYSDLQKSRPDEDDIIEAEVIAPEPAKPKPVRNWK